MGGEPGHSTLIDDARAIYEAAIGAVDPARLVKAKLSLEGDGLRIMGETFDLGGFEHVYVIAFGKAAAGMAAGLAEVLGDRLSGGLVVSPSTGGAEGGPGRRPDAPHAYRPGGPGNAARLEEVKASHPLPDDTSVEAARRALDLAAGAREKDLVLLAISGGGSALLSLPADGITVDDKKTVTLGLLRAGASIRELNVVRKHLSGIKGGRLARAAHPATVISLVISDVVGDDLETIASGPAHWDSSTFADARDLLARYGLWESSPPSVRQHVERGVRGEEPETLKSDDPVFGSVHEHVIGNNLTALRGARREAERRGFEPFILTSGDEGEARAAARSYVAFIASVACSMSGAPLPFCLLAGGELTVSVTGRGTGGRNMEFVLAALVEMRKEGLGSSFCGTCALPGDRGGLAGNRPLDWLVLSLGTDGIDGPTGAAGAWADAATFDRASALGLDPEKFLGENDSYSFFEKTENLIVTGPTGTNVCDVRVFLIAPPPE
ncbi:MAG: glycerate kinase type-2 family protein [Candidatus Aminicenantales bacterium]